MNTTNRKQRRAVSPILATVLLLGITVVGGGLTYTLMSSGASTASTQNLIALENAQAVKGTSHADMTATIKNSGTVPWKTLEMTVAKTELSEPLLYEALHENVGGCSGSVDSAGACSTGAISGKIDNPLRSQWLATLDITGKAASTADKGEGISAGRKFVLSTDAESYRTTVALNGTAFQKVLTTTVTTNDITSGEACVTGTTFSDCTTLFKALDSSTAGNISCKSDGTSADVTKSNIECKVFTHQKLSSQIQPGQSVQIYADAFTKDVTGLNNVKVQVGDALVVNIVAKGDNGSEARYQTVIKVTGI
jgi:flagellin-like protein